jgi:hypothetical protein
LQVESGFHEEMSTMSTSDDSSPAASSAKRNIDKLLDQVLLMKKRNTDMFSLMVDKMGNYFDNKLLEAKNDGMSTYIKQVANYSQMMRPELKQTYVESLRKERKFLLQKMKEKRNKDNKEEKSGSMHKLCLNLVSS